MKTLSLTRRASTAAFAIAMLAAIIMVPPYRAETRTFVLETVNSTETISFDPAKISESRLRELIVLSPFVVDFINDMPDKNFWAVGSVDGTLRDKAFTALPLELCIASEPVYSDCGTNDIDAPRFSHNAEVNLKKNRRGLFWLQHLDHPKQLDPVVKFLDQRLSLSIWIEEARLKYYSTWDERALMEVYNDIDPGQICSSVFPKLEAANSKEAKYQIVRSDWANCMRASDRRRYPIDAWRAFLQAYGVTEDYKEKSPD